MRRRRAVRSCEGNIARCKRRELARAWVLALGRAALRAAEEPRRPAQQPALPALRGPGPPLLRRLLLRMRRAGVPRRGGPPRRLRLLLLLPGCCPGAAAAVGSRLPGRMLLLPLRRSMLPASPAVVLAASVDRRGCGGLRGLSAGDAPSAVLPGRCSVPIVAPFKQSKHSLGICFESDSSCQGTCAPA
jgi:hypothetical protein